MPAIFGWPFGILGVCRFVILKMAKYPNCRFFFRTNILFTISQAAQPDFGELGQESVGSKGSCMMLALKFCVIFLCFFGWYFLLNKL